MDICQFSSTAVKQLLCVERPDSVEKDCGLREYTNDHSKIINYRLAKYLFLLWSVCITLLGE